MNNSSNVGCVNFHPKYIENTLKKKNWSWAKIPNGRRSSKNQSDVGVCENPKSTKNLGGDVFFCENPKSTQNQSSDVFCENPKSTKNRSGDGFRGRAGWAPYAAYSAVALDTPTPLPIIISADSHENTKVKERTRTWREKRPRKL